MKNVPETSKEAFRSLRIEEINETYRMIISALSALNEATTEEIAAFLKVDHSKIWKRHSELERMELIYRPGNKRKMKSNRSGFTWMLRNPPKTDQQARIHKPTEPPVSTINVLRQANLFQ